MKKKSDLSQLKTRNRSEWIKREPTTDLGHRIVRAAVEEFAAKGIAGARVAEITRKAGTTDPSFYRYFAGMKQAALYIMSEYYWAPLNTRMRHYRQITQDPVRLFETVVEALIQSAEDDPSRPWLAESLVFRIVVVQMRNPYLLPESMMDSEYRNFLHELEAILRSGQKEATFRNALKPALLAQLLVTSLHGLLMLNSLPGQPIRVAMEEIRKVAASLVGVNSKPASRPTAH